MGKFESVLLIVAMIIVPIMIVCWAWMILKQILAPFRERRKRQEEIIAYRSAYWTALLKAQGIDEAMCDRYNPEAWERHGRLEAKRQVEEWMRKGGEKLVLEKVKEYIEKEEATRKRASEEDYSGVRINYNWSRIYADAEKERIFREILAKMEKGV